MSRLVLILSPAEGPLFEAFGEWMREGCDGLIYVVEIAFVNVQVYIFACSVLSTV